MPESEGWAAPLLRDTFMVLDDEIGRIDVHVEAVRRFGGVRQPQDAVALARAMAEVRARQAVALGELADWAQALEADGWSCGWDLWVDEELICCVLQPPDGVRVRQHAARINELAERWAPAQIELDVYGLRRSVRGGRADPCSPGLSVALLR